MAALALSYVSSLSELAQYHDSWNDLWQRSATYLPTCRAEVIDLWVRHFAADQRFSAILVTKDGQLAAALPLVHYQKAGVAFASLPVNCWANAGDLLIDEHLDPAPIIDKLVAGLAYLPVSVLTFDEVPVDTARWQAFQSGLQRAGKEQAFLRENRVGIVDVGSDWPEYLARWKSKPRRSLKRLERRLREAGDIQLRRYGEDTDQLPELMSVAFELENRSWKGDAGSSVLATPGMADYLLQEAAIASRDGFLDLWLLHVDEVPIAFGYCHRSKGVCVYHKTGYDPGYRQFAPGKLLKRFQFEQLHHDPDVRLVDLLGTFSASKAEWATRTYRNGRIVAAIGGTFSNVLVRSFLQARPLVRGLFRQQAETPIVPKLEPPLHDDGSSVPS